MSTSTNNISILFAVWELEPFLKVGGLGELARSLPRALYAEGIDIRLVMPYYQALKLRGQKKEYISTITSAFHNKELKIQVYKIYFPNRPIPVYLLKHQYFSKIKQYTFAVFCKAIVTGLSTNSFDFSPQIIHCNDHHTGLIPLFVRSMNLPYKTLMTIHSMYSQSRMPKDLVTKLGIDEKFCHFMNWEIEGKKFNFLLEGIVNADIVNTVSPTYAKEILTEPEGRDLEEYLIAVKKSGKFLAILNGIDYELKNPETDSKLKYRFSSLPRNQSSEVFSINEGKEKNKLQLQRKLKLTLDPKIPLIGFIGRFSREQKGIDTLHKVILKWSSNNPVCQFVCMGQGETSWEERFRTLAAFKPNTVAAITTYDESISSLIYAASDFTVVPSVFEPCGQVQMNAMRYGAIPIVRDTGGLTDTVRDGLNGFIYTSRYSLALESAILRALEIYNSVPNLFRALRENCVTTDNSWEASAKAYAQVYKRLLTNQMYDTESEELSIATSSGMQSISIKS